MNIEPDSDINGLSLTVDGQELAAGSSIRIDLVYGTKSVTVVVTPDGGTLFPIP